MRKTFNQIQKEEAAWAIQYGNLSRKVDTIDQALYVASCFCAQDAQIIYCSTHPDVAAPETGERYLVFDESDRVRFHLAEDQDWEPVYRIERWTALREGKQASEVS